ncbi:MAG TPA: hypothetical protein VE870_11195 [Bacteroidales bacterium]|nr:hypothetical protein [Bacteroidales bacterium]
MSNHTGIDGPGLVVVNDRKKTIDTTNPGDPSVGDPVHSCRDVPEHISSYQISDFMAYSALSRSIKIYES